MGGGPPGFTPGFPCPVLLGIATEGTLSFGYGAVTRCGWLSHTIHLNMCLLTSWTLSSKSCRSRDTGVATAATLHDAGLGSSPFARRYWGSRVFFLFLQVLRCFSSLRFLRARVVRTVPGDESWSVSRSRRPPDQSLLAAPRSLSQLTTSFFGYGRQGIHHTLLVA